MKKRVFSILLSICMVLTMIPMAGGGVFATGTGTGESGTAAGHTHCVCGKDASVSVNGHTHSEAVTFTAWQEKDSLPAEPGNYYLTENVTVDGVWKPADGTVLCLNGKTITGEAKDKYVIHIINGSFDLTDCCQNTGSIAYGGGGVLVNNGKTFNMYAGIIRNSINRGLVIYGTANMYDGVIKENGGGVTLDYKGYTPNFNMYGGSVIKNKTASSEGAGVYRIEGRFTVSGNVQIVGNSKGNEINNVFSNNCGQIYIGAGGLDENTQIGLKQPSNVGAKSIVAENNIDYSNRFTADDAGIEIRYRQDKKTLYFDSLQKQTGFDFASKTLDKQYGDSVENRLEVGFVGGKVTYSSNNPTVASVDEDTGDVTIVGVGPAIIKAIKRNQSSNIDYYTYYDLTVNKRTAVADDFTFTPPAHLVYDGSAKVAQVALKSRYTGCGDITVKYCKADSEVTEVKNAGEYTVKVDVAEGENFNSVNNLVVGTFTVVAKELTADMIANIPAQTYTGNAITPEVTVTDEGKPLVKGTDYDVAYAINPNSTGALSESKPIGAGTYNVIITGKGNYSGEITKTFVIDKADPSYSVPGDLNATYGDKLSAVTLPNNWSWMNPDDTVGNVTAYGSSNTHKAKYTPADTDNYNVIENIEVPVKVSAKQEADVIAPEIRVLAGESRKVDLSSYKKNDMDKIGSAHTYDNVFDRSIPPHKVQDKEMVGFTVKSDAAAGDSGIITVGVDSADGNTYYDIKFKVTVRSKSSGGTYKPPVQKPSITAGEGFKAELSSDGTKATITVEEGYEIVDVLVNGISKGKVTEITGLKTGDTIEVKTEKKQTEPVKPADNKHIIRGVKNTEIELEITVNKDGNIVIKWKKSKGYRVDGFEILRAVKKNGKYSKIYTTKSGKASRIVNAKNLKDGKRYYYKVRGVRTIDGKKYYTEWSDIESKKVKK